MRRRDWLKRVIGLALGSVALKAAASPVPLYGPGPLIKTVDIIAMRKRMELYYRSCVPVCLDSIIATCGGISENCKITYEAYRR